VEEALLYPVSSLSSTTSTAFYPPSITLSFIMPNLRDFDLKKFGGIPLDQYKPVPGLTLESKSLNAEQKKQLLFNINLFRDSIVFFTATGAARGVSGHTGGPYDVCPEVVILLSLFENEKGKFVPTLYDEAGHRSALAYLRSALEGHLKAEDLLNYRRAYKEGGAPGLPGHPELNFTPGVEFSSGRLGHQWPFTNGVALANPDKITVMLGSDGSQQEGNDAEAARLAVAQQLNIKLFIDDNDVTIAGHPSEYFKGFSVAKTLDGHGLKVFHAEGEDLDSLFPNMMECLRCEGPAALVSTRKMCPGIKGLEGETHGHDVIPVNTACEYLQEKGYPEAVSFLKSLAPDPSPLKFIGSSKDKGANRSTFGEAFNAILDKTSVEENKKKILVIDSDLAGSTGLAAIKKKREL
jgi:transketolase N-terminal domain/subunit